VDCRLEVWDGGLWYGLPAMFDTELQPSRNPKCNRMHYGVKMKTDTDNMKLRVQETLDELLSEHLIPFELTAQKVNADGLGEYEVPFYDSRMHSIRFSWKDGGFFKEVVRAAVLDRVKRMRSPAEG